MSILQETHDWDGPGFGHSDSESYNFSCLRPEPLNPGILVIRCVPFVLLSKTFTQKVKWIKSDSNFIRTFSHCESGKYKLNTWWTIKFGTALCQMAAQSPPSATCRTQWFARWKHKRYFVFLVLSRIHKTASASVPVQIFTQLTQIIVPYPCDLAK